MCHAEWAGKGLDGVMSAYQKLHCFIDHLQEGKDADSFFANIN